MQDFRVPGHGARARGAAAGDGRDAAVRRRERGARSIPGIVQGRAQGQLPRASSPRRMGGDPAARDGSRRPGRTGRACPTRRKLWEHVRATKVVKDEVFQNVGNAPRRWRRAPRRSPRPTTSPSTRTARSARRARSPSTRTASSPSWIGVAGDAHSAQAARATCSRMQAGQRALHLPRRLGLLRPQRPRGRRRRRRAAREGDSAGRCACSGSRAGRARLGPEGTADAARHRGGARRERQRRGVGVGGLHPAIGRRAST